MRIKFVKSFDGFDKGSIINTDGNSANDYIKKGVAILSKDLVESDYKTLDEGQANAKLQMSTVRKKL